ncbi:heavy metal translocating P-type ATPase [Candidatus Palauibacter sp.]|uniref:heavy metal translocating P-type ATPase n=1 Tax=Candidatus Palauibacter sp. TaxID=3101350 RepID=UPI003B02A25A
MNGNTRPSPWTTSEAIRTYASGALWTAGLVLVFVVGHGPDQAGWWRIRTDAAGWVFLAGALVGGWNFFPKGVRAARTLRLDMNFLMTAAIAGAVLIGEPLEAAAIAFLFSLAELLESSAVVRARHSIDALLRLAPEVATLVAEDGSERTVPASDLRAGERVRVRPGEKVPIDGVVVEGQSGVNQANVTGESVPVAKGVGDPVFASTLNTDGFLEIEATTDAGDTTLHRIARLVREAQSKRSPTEQFVQKFARYYTPAVTAAAVLVMAVPPLLGLGTGLMWFERGLTLLVIACPCALVIATPVTIVSAITSAARHGVLIKGGEYVESLGATCAIAFDKTGTLTLGELHVTDVVPLGDMSEDRLVRLAATLERRSEHPIAEAIVRYASETGGLREEGWTVEDFRAHPGLGVTATVDGARVAVGTIELLAPADGARGFGDHFDALQRAGRTVVVVARDGVPLGLIGLADALRPEAPGVLARLRREGVHHQILLTGDQNYAARAIGDAVGVDEVMAELKPEGKVAAVREIVRAHRGAAMVGDGVNDAPALAAADVGIAMGGAGSPATIETADIALMADDLNMLPYARRVSQLARRLVRFNIAFALGIKAILAVGAVGGFVSLIVAVLVGDMGASLAVTLNAMRLARLKPRQAGDPPRGDHVA